MSVAGLEMRLRGWMERDWQAVVFEREGKPVGHLLFQFRTDEYRPSDASAYVRQFFVKREHRRKGIGRRAFDITANQFFSNVSTTILDVLAANPGARRFWEAVGFEPYRTTMKRTRKSESREKAIPNGSHP